MATKKNTPPKPARALPSIPKELLEQFADGPTTAEAIQDAAMAFKKALIERALGAEPVCTWAIPAAQSGLKRCPISATARSARRS